MYNWYNVEHNPFFKKAFPTWQEIETFSPRTRRETTETLQNPDFISVPETNLNGTLVQENEYLKDFKGEPDISREFFYVQKIEETPDGKEKRILARSYNTRTGTWDGDPILFRTRDLRSFIGINRWEMKKEIKRRKKERLQKMKIGPQYQYQY